MKIEKVIKLLQRPLKKIKNVEKEWTSPNENGTSAKIKHINDFEENGSPAEILNKL